MATHTYDTSTDLNVLTRDFLRKTIKKQLFLRSPLVTRLAIDGRMTQKGGIKETITVKDVQGTSEVQVYGVNDALTSAVVNRTNHFRFGLSNMQTPIRWTIQEKVENINADNSARVADLLTKKVEFAWDATYDKMQELIYDPSTTESAATPTLLSLQTALTHDRQYGGVTRSTTATNEWWQGRSPAGTYTDQATAAAATIPNFRAWRDVCDRYNDRSGDSKIVVVGDALYRQFLAAAESRHINTQGAGKTAEYGHESIVIDGVEFVKDKYLGANSTRAKYFFYLDTSTWNYEVDKDRNFKMTDGFWQGQVDGGADYWVQRIMVIHRFFCDQCNANMYLSNVT